MDTLLPDSIVLKACDVGFTRTNHVIEIYCRRMEAVTHPRI